MIAFASPQNITNEGYVKNIYCLRWTLFGAPNESFAFETQCKTDTETMMKIDFSARFYFAQLFILFSALSIIFFLHFEKKWLLIHWL